MALIDEFDMESTLVHWQAGRIPPRHAIEAARRRVQQGQGGEITREVAAMSLTIGKDTRLALEAHLPGLLEELGVEQITDLDAAQRMFLRTCQRIVDGDVPPLIGAAVISALEDLPDPAQGRTQWERIRPFYANAEDAHPDDNPSDSFIREVETRILEDARQFLDAEDSAHPSR
jgi:hypothetical protein